MKTFLKTSILLSVTLVALVVACQREASREERNSTLKVQNLEAFARLYGYARWFHPSDEAQEIDWDKFAVLGVRKVENVKSTEELRDTLYRLFSPVVQGLQIYDARKPEIFNPESLLSPDPEAKPVAWQHHGVYLNEKSNMYKSIRTNKSKADKQDEKTTVTKGFSDSSLLNGKKVNFSGYFKVKKGSAKLFIQPIDFSGNSKKHEVSITSQEWKRYELTLTIPEETVAITYGFEIDGDAEVWVDDFAFAVNKGRAWELANTENSGFECGKAENGTKIVDHWSLSVMYHTVEVTDKNPFSGNYCLKACYVGKMFDRIPQFGETTKAAIGNNLICMVPLTLLTNGSSTYPQTDKTIVARLHAELENSSVNSYGFNPQENLASIVITWNVLQHFFPYFDVIDTDWNAVLGETLKSTLANKRKKDFFITLSQMIAKLDDGHGNVSGEQMYHLPIRTEVAENEIVITASTDSTLKRGDIIRQINRKPAMDVLNEKEKIISGSPQLRRYKALDILGSKLDSHRAMNKNRFELANDNFESNFDSDGTLLVIERDGKEQNVTAANSGRLSLFYNPVDDRKYLTETIVEIEPGIYYINMGNCTKSEFEQKNDLLSKAKAVIYDQRRAGNLNFSQIIPYLIEKPATSTWWNIPQTVYPDRKEVEFNKSKWSIQPKQPHFKSKVVIINVPSVISVGETRMGIIDYYNLATTVGEPTAGCNGNVNYINLPCGYEVMWTGMKVLKHDGSPLYLKGFEPDYPVRRTIRAVKEGRDEFLEKALEVAKKE